MSGRKIDYLWAFVIGGLIGVVAQAIFMLLLAFDIAYAYAVTLMLAAVATIGVILTVCEQYQRLEALSGFGAMTPLSGFSAAIASFTAAALDGGAKPRQAAWDGLRAGVTIFGIGLPVALLVALLQDIAA